MKYSINIKIKLIDEEGIVKQADMYLYDENQNLIDGRPQAGVYPAGQVSYLKQSLTRTDLTPLQTEEIKAKIEGLEEFLKNPETDFWHNTEDFDIVESPDQKPISDPEPVKPQIPFIPKAPIPIPPKSFLQKAKDLMVR